MSRSKADSVWLFVGIFGVVDVLLNLHDALDGEPTFVGLCLLGVAVLVVFAIRETRIRLRTARQMQGELPPPAEGRDACP